MFTFGIRLPQRSKTQFLQNRVIKISHTHENFFTFWRFLLSLGLHPPISYRGASKWRAHISHFLSRRKPPKNRVTMKPTTFLSNLSLWAVQLIAMLLEVLFSPSVFEEGQTQKALTFGTAKASTLISSTMKTSDQCVETSVANHLPPKDCRTTAWAIAADISQLLWQQVPPKELAWWSSPEWVRRK